MLEVLEVLEPAAVYTTDKSSSRLNTKLDKVMLLVYIKKDVFL